MPTIPRARAIGGRSGGSSALGRIAVLIAGSIPRLRLRDGNIPLLGKREFEESPNSPDFWMNVGIAFALVVLGGIFAGLTLGYVFLCCLSFAMFGLGRFQVYYGG